MSDYYTHRWPGDDRDREKNPELVLTFAPNGDFYISVAADSEECPFTAVRICMSGGTARANPKLAQAVRDMWEALGGFEAAKAEAD